MAAQDIGEFSMKTRHNPVITQSLASLIGCIILTGLAATVNAEPPTPVTVADITDWSTTPMEVVTASFPTLNYNSLVYAGINTLSVTENGNATVYGGFCIDPFPAHVCGAHTCDFID